MLDLVRPMCEKHISFFFWRRKNWVTPVPFFSPPGVGVGGERRREGRNPILKVPGDDMICFFNYWLLKSSLELNFYIPRNLPHFSPSFEL